MAHRATEAVAQADRIAIGRRPARLGPPRRPLAAAAGATRTIPEHRRRSREPRKTPISQQHGQSQAELQQLRAQIGAAQQQLGEARKAAAGRNRSYAVVPYEGPNQTRRRPIYLECRADAVVLQPEGIDLTEADFEGPLGPGNPLAAALRAAREYLLAQRDFDPQAGEPYPMLLVRPEGIAAYYAARAAMKSWGCDFGYELVGDDWKLAYPPPDPRLAEVVRQAIASARVTQARLIAAAPRQYATRPKAVYRASPSGGFVREDGGSDDDDDDGYRPATPAGPVGTQRRTRATAVEEPAATAARAHGGRRRHGGTGGTADGAGSDYNPYVAVGRTPGDCGPWGRRPGRSRRPATFPPTPDLRWRLPTAVALPAVKPAAVGGMAAAVLAARRHGQRQCRRRNADGGGLAVRGGGGSPVAAAHAWRHRAQRLGNAVAGGGSADAAAANPYGHQSERTADCRPTALRSGAPSATSDRSNGSADQRRGDRASRRLRRRPAAARASVAANRQIRRRPTAWREDSFCGPASGSRRRPPPKTRDDKKDDDDSATRNPTNAEESCGAARRGLGTARRRPRLGRRHPADSHRVLRRPAGGGFRPQSGRQQGRSAWPAHRVVDRHVHLGRLGAYGGLGDGRPRHVLASGVAGLRRPRRRRAFRRSVGPAGRQRADGEEKVVGSGQWAVDSDAVTKPQC